MIYELWYREHLIRWQQGYTGSLSLRTVQVTMVCKTGNTMKEINNTRRRPHSAFLSKSIFCIETDALWCTALQISVDFSGFSRATRSSLSRTCGILDEMTMTVKRMKSTILFRHKCTGCQGGSKKWGYKLMAIILSNLNRFTFFFTGRLPGKFAVNWLLKYHHSLHMLP